MTLINNQPDRLLGTNPLSPQWSMLKLIAMLNSRLSRAVDLINAQYASTSVPWEDRTNCSRVSVPRAQTLSSWPFRGYTYDRGRPRCSFRPFSVPVPHTDTTIDHASRSLCNATPYAFIRAYPHDKHRAVIDICPYRSKGLRIIRPSNNVAGGGYGDHRDNVASPNHNCDYHFLVFTARETCTFHLSIYPLR